MNRDAIDAEYYQSLHDNHPAFQGNNWLVQDFDLLSHWSGDSLLELGCGNGLFMKLAMERWSRVVGVDWAQSPVLDKLLVDFPKMEFSKADILAWEPNEVFDLVVSADFLEHLPPEKLADAIRKFHSFGKRHYHRIACYDDGHSHLSIFPPEKWLEVFERAVGSGYELLSSEARKGDSSKLVVAIGYR